MSLDVRTNDALADVKLRGPGAPMLALTSRRCLRIARTTVANKPVHRGERKINVKTIAQGGPGRSGCTCGSCPVHSFARGPRASAEARPSLRPRFR